jgi:hypothetical protein
MSTTSRGIHSTPGRLPSVAAGITDRGRRASDLVNYYRAESGIPWEDLKTKYLAFRLWDGSSDGILYDTKRDAVRHQAYEQQCAYVCFVNLVDGSNPREMETYLAFCEKAYDAGFRLVDPDDVTGGPDIIPTTPRMDDFRTRVHPAMVATSPALRTQFERVLRELERVMPE